LSPKEFINLWLYWWSRDEEKRYSDLCYLLSSIFLVK
jgi:hypothetical protein